MKIIFIQAHRAWGIPSGGMRDSRIMGSCSWDISVSAFVLAFAFAQVSLSDYTDLHLP